MKILNDTYVTTFYVDITNEVNNIIGNVNLSSFMCIFRDMFHDKDIFTVDDISCNDKILIKVKFVRNIKRNIGMYRISKVINRKLKMAIDWINNN